EAFQGLLRGRGVYDAETAYTTLAPYQRGAASLPSDVSSAPAAGSLVTGRALEYLVEAEEQMIRADAEAQLDRETNGEIKIYTDPLLAHSRRRYSTFVKDLRRKGLVGFSREPKEFVGVFFVWKKERASMWMALDCRRSNQRFVTPPGVELLSTEGLGRIECEAEQADALPIFLGKADVKNCFRRVLFGSHLLPPGGGAKEFGIVGQAVDGVPARAEDTSGLAPLLSPWAGRGHYTLPKLSTWAWWRGCPPSRRAAWQPTAGPLSCWRPPLLGTTSYVDNVGLLSLDAACVKGALADTAKAFDAAGLIMHDISVDCETAEALGVTLDGQKHQTLVTHRRYWKVRLGLRRALSLRRLAGRELEVLLGHCAFVGLMRREALSARHTVYTFIRERYWAKSDVWGSARHELECFLGLMPFLRSEWDRPWLPQVLSVDASLCGWGIASSEFGVDDGKERDPSDIQAARVWEMREDFPEIPGGLLHVDRWISPAWWLTDTDPTTSCSSLRIDLYPRAYRLKRSRLGLRPTPLLTIYFTTAMKRTRNLEASNRTPVREESRRTTLRASPGSTSCPPAAFSRPTKHRILCRPKIRSMLESSESFLSMGCLETLVDEGLARAAAAVAAAAAADAADEDSVGTTTGDEMERSVMARSPECPRAGGSKMPRAWWRAIAVVFARRRMVATGLAIMIGVSCYLRPSRLLNPTSSNLVAPTSHASQHWILLLHPSEKEDRSKSGGANDLPNIHFQCMLPWVTDFLQALRGKGGQLWSFDYLTFLAELKTVAKVLGVYRLVPYQMRHSGLSIDRMVPCRKQEECQKRGRRHDWKSIDRYEESAHLSSFLYEPPVEMLAHMHLCEDQFVEFLLSPEHAP
ncbi:unnamed protein product, partial [Prorocentrum cordatum]